MELMSTSLQHSRFPISDSASAATSSHIALISASSNLSAAVVQCVDGAQECYVWGSGLPTTNMRVPLSMPPKFEQKIKQLSCGQSHAGFVTFDGKVYTWGANDSGMLGHGGKASLNAPKRIDSMNKMEVVAISCGAYHTAIIASEEDRPCDYITVPDYYAMDSLEGRSNRYSIKRPEESFLPSGSLYCFGMGKAGQLGLDSIAKKGTSSSARNVGKPTKVSHFEKAKEKVIKVSCGFHHTLVITVPADDVSSNTGFYQPTVYSFGWGEHGRLGNGTEIESVVPVKVEFPEPFTALDVCAGEQHSLAAGREDCYAWGNNSMGQLGVSNPASTPQALSPLKIILPEGMKVRYLGAGGRHSAAITYCNRLLTWGWGEDGQLGHGTEKSSYLPRPCKIPRIASKAGNPVSLSLGMSHTLVLLKNKEYVPQLPEVVEKETVKEEAELKVVEEAVPIEATVVPLDPIPEPEPEPKLELWTNEEADIEFEHELLQEVSPPPPVLNHKPAYLVDEYELMEPNETKPEPPQVVRGIKELLHQREERIQRYL